MRESGLDCVYAEDLGLPDFERIAYKYDILELSTALKPTFLKRMMAEGFERVVYLDPDIELHAPLQPVWDALNGAEIVLDATRAPPGDGLVCGRPTSTSCALASYNSSASWRCVAETDDPLALSRLVGVALPVVRLRRPGARHLRGPEVDGPRRRRSSSRCACCRHPGCNVAYWNLHERTVTYDGTRTLVNGVPLCFFHFSGVRMQAPGVLSNTPDAPHARTPHPARAAGRASTAASLSAARHATFSTVRYTLGTLDGRPISGTMRRALLSSEIVEVAPFPRLTRPSSAELRAAGITAAADAGAVVDTKNFDQGGRQVTIVNSLVRTIARVIGTEACAPHGALRSTC
ncbi:MAG: hypothetical protein U5K74_07455 [Gemmatimonadaceae bacterium]|nr:hypothetical protein [Gemmatimonadaceae bacterium]